VFGGLAGAVIAGLVGSAAGRAAGSAVGGPIDDNVLGNHHSLACGQPVSHGLVTIRVDYKHLRAACTSRPTEDGEFENIS
jgi:outer membrane lipoprotein SlyB